MRILVFDTETTGLPASKILNPDTLHLWPHIVQLSYIMYDTDLNDIIDSNDTIIKLKNNMQIPQESTNIHKITNEISQNKGVDIELVATDFLYQLKKCDMLVGHNISFDINMIKVELLRIIYSTSNTLSIDELSIYKTNFHLVTNFKNIYCTMFETIKFCDLKSVNKNGKPYAKFPKLSELHQQLFQCTPNNLHNSFNDILVTLRCFIKFKFDIDLNTNCRSFIELTKEINLFQEQVTI